MGRLDLTFAADWALKNKYLSIYLSIYLHVVVERKHSLRAVGRAVTHTYYGAVFQVTQDGTGLHVVGGRGGVSGYGTEAQ